MRDGVVDGDGGDGGELDGGDDDEGVVEGCDCSICSSMRANSTSLLILALGLKDGVSDGIGSDDGVLSCSCLSTLKVRHSTKQKLSTNQIIFFISSEIVK